jgi:chromosome segregation ATPase
MFQERDGFKSQLELLRDKISSLSRQLADGEDRRMNKDQRVNEMALQVEDLRSQLATLQHKLSAAQSQIVAEEAALAAARSDYAQLQCDHTAKKVAWNAMHGQLVSDCDGFKCQVHALQDKVAEMSRLCANREESIVAKEALALQLQQECRDLQGQLEACEGRATTALHSLQACERKVLACEGNLQECKSALEERENKLGRAVEELARAQGKSKRETAVWKGERAQLVSDRDGYKGQMDTLRDKVAELANQLAIALESGEKIHVRPTVWWRP